MSVTIWERLAPIQKNEINNIALAIDIELDDLKVWLQKQTNFLNNLRQIVKQLRSFSDAKLSYLIEDAIKLGETVTIVCNRKKAQGKLKRLYVNNDVFHIVGWDSKFITNSHLHPHYGIRFGLSQIVKIDNENDKLVLFLEQNSDNKDALRTNIGSQMRTYNKSLKRMMATRNKPVEAVKEAVKPTPQREFAPITDKFIVFRGHTVEGITRLEKIAEFYDYEQAFNYANSSKELSVIRSDYFNDVENIVANSNNKKQKKMNTKLLGLLIQYQKDSKDSQEWASKVIENIISSNNPTYLAHLQGILQNLRTSIENILAEQDESQ